LPYVGQSGNFPRRISEHLQSRNLDREDLPYVYVREVLGGRSNRRGEEQTVIREFIETGRFNERGSIQDILRNKINAIQPSRFELIPKK
jgi:hypothetical protein